MTEITLFDGGMGQELVTRSGDTPTPLWSTRVMVDRPGLVQAIHADYFAAGATIATANTYAIHRDRLTGTDLQDRFEDLHQLAIDEAAAARDKAGHGRIAGAIGPLGFSYRPDKHPPHEEAVTLYAEVAGLWADRVDLIICETVASVAHARAILDATVSLGKPVWLACTVDDEDGRILRSGEPMAEAAQIAGDMGAAAVLANCSAPEAMLAALDAMAPTGLPYGAYANGFTQITKDYLKPAATVEALSARRDMGPDPYADHAMQWVDHGATLIGGCCEVGPAHIAEIARRLRAAGHTIT